MFRRHHLAVLALGLAASPLAAQQAGPPLALQPVDWSAPAPAVAAVDVPAVLTAPFAGEAARSRLGEARTSRRERKSVQFLTALVGMVAGGAAGGSVMSRQCAENCGVKAFYGALAGSTLGFTVGFTLGRAAEGGDPAITIPRPASLDD